MQLENLQQSGATAGLQSPDSHFEGGELGSSPKADEVALPVTSGCVYFVSSAAGNRLSNADGDRGGLQPLLHLTGDASSYREGSLHRLIAARSIQGVRQWLSNPFCRDSINDFNHAGETPLHVALHVCEPRIISLLLDPPALQLPSQFMVASSVLPSQRPAETSDFLTEANERGKQDPEQTPGFPVSPLCCEEARAAAIAALTTSVDFSLPLDDLPALHLLVSRASFPALRADAVECLRRILRHFGLLTCSGGVRTCSRCSLGVAEASTEESGTRADDVSSPGQRQNVECLVRPELDLDAADGSGKTALHVAAGGGAAMAVDLLVHAGADPLLPDKRGLLPLHVAVDARSAESLLALLPHSLPRHCLFWGGSNDAQQRQPSRAHLTVGSAGAGGGASPAPETSRQTTGADSEPSPKRVVVEHVKRRPLVECAASSCVVYRVARRCVRRSSFRCLAALLSYPLHPAAADTCAWEEGQQDPSRAVCLALQLLSRQQLYRLWQLACRSGCRKMLMSTFAALVDGQPKTQCGDAVLELMEEDARRGEQPNVREPVYVQQRCSKSGRLNLIPEESGTLLATHACCMNHLPLPEPSDYPVKRFKLMQRFPENPSRLEVLVQPSSGVLKAVEFSHLSWIDSAPPASLADILRVHDPSYVFRLKQKITATFGARSSESCAGGEGPEGRHSRAATEGLSPVDRFAYTFADRDTPVTALSWEAATRAAGTVIAAVDAVCSGAAVNAFCAVRPPGHHLGSWGAAQTAPFALTDEDVAAGSQGFCLLNNVAIGAAYARYKYAAQGIRRIAIVDFDVHHGNGTEQIVRNVGLKFRRINGSCSMLSQSAVHFGQPQSGASREGGSAWEVGSSWEVEDSRGSGECEAPERVLQVPLWMGWRDESDAEDIFFASIHVGPTILNVTLPVHDQVGYSPESVVDRGCCSCARCTRCQCVGRERRVENEGRTDNYFKCHYCRFPNMSCRSIQSRILFKRRVLRRLEAFKPDIIFLSAGFDGHAKDPIGGEVVGWTEDDFYWLTLQVQRVAQRHCKGRCVSVLEGGYNVRGGAISPLAVCVREHVRALVKASHMHLEESRGTELDVCGNSRSENYSAYQPRRSCSGVADGEGDSTAERLFGAGTSEGSNSDFSSAEEETLEYSDRVQPEPQHCSEAVRAGDCSSSGSSDFPVPRYASAGGQSLQSHSYPAPLNHPQDSETPLCRPGKESVGGERCQATACGSYDETSWVGGASVVQAFPTLGEEGQSPSAFSSFSDGSGAAAVGETVLGGRIAMSDADEGIMGVGAVSASSSAVEFQPSLVPDAVPLTEDEVPCCSKARRLQQLCGTLE